MKINGSGRPLDEPTGVRVTVESLKRVGSGVESGETKEHVPRRRNTRAAAPAKLRCFTHGRSGNWLSFRRFIARKTVTPLTLVTT